MPALPLYLTLPLLLGLLYSLSALAFKRAMTEGVDIWRIIFYSNGVTAMFLVPLLLLVDKPQNEAAVYQPLITGLVFFAGIVLNILAIQKGDVSVATPLLGAKVLFVALFTLWILDEAVLPSLWIAAVLAAVAFKMLHWPKNRPPTRFWATFTFAMGSSSAFALCDVFFQAWARVWGIGLFIPAVFTVVCVFSYGLRWWFPERSGSLSAGARRWLAAGCVLNGLQTLGMFICLSLFRHPNAAAAINIVYNSRGIWSVLLVWFIGHRFGNIERDQGLKVMAARLGGSALLLIAIVLTLLRR